MRLCVPQQKQPTGGTRRPEEPLQGNGLWMRSFSSYVDNKGGFQSALLLAKFRVAWLVRLRIEIGIMALRVLVA